MYVPSSSSRAGDPIRLINRTVAVSTNRIPSIGIDGFRRDDRLMPKPAAWVCWGGGRWYGWSSPNRRARDTDATPTAPPGPGGAAGTEPRPAEDERDHGGAIECRIHLRSDLGGPRWPPM